MKLLLGLLAMAVGGGIAQQSADQLKHIYVPTVNGMNLVRITAQEIERASLPAVDHLRGSVEIKTPFCVTVAMAPKQEYCDGYVVLHADEAEFHEDTEQVEARGNVRVERVVEKR